MGRSSDNLSEFWRVKGGSHLISHFFSCVLNSYRLSSRFLKSPYIFNSFTWVISLRIFDYYFSQCSVYTLHLLYYLIILF